MNVRPVSSFFSKIEHRSGVIHMDIRDFAALYSLPVQEDKNLLDDGSTYSIPGKNGYITHYAETPGWLAAGIVTLSATEKFKTRMRLRFAGCKLQKRDSSFPSDKFDNAVIGAEFNPSNSKQSRLVISLAILPHYD